MKPLSILTCTIIGLCFVFPTGYSKLQEAEEAHLHTIQAKDTLKTKA